MEGAPGALADGDYSLVESTPDTPNHRDTWREKYNSAITTNAL